MLNCNTLRSFVLGSMTKKILRSINCFACFDFVILCQPAIVQRHSPNRSMPHTDWFKAVHTRHFKWMTKHSGNSNINKQPPHFPYKSRSEIIDIHELLLISFVSCPHQYWLQFKAFSIAIRITRPTVLNFPYTLRFIYYKKWILPVNFGTTLWGQL